MEIKNGDLAFEIKDGTLVACRGWAESIVLPSEVVLIEEGAFSDIRQPFSLVLSEGVSTILSSAFENCNTLKSIHLPTSLRAIHRAAFSGCGSLTEVHVPSLAAFLSVGFFGVGSNPLSAGAGLYVNGALLREAVIPKEKDFKNCSALSQYAYLEAISVEEGHPTLRAEGNCLITPEGGVVLGCKNSVIPDDGSVTTICTEAFGGSDIREIDIPPSVEGIGTRAFYSCKRLSRVGFSEGLRFIGNQAFEGCEGLFEVRFPSTLSEIGAEAFYGSALVELELPEGLLTLGELAFSESPALKSVTFPKKIKTVGEGCFRRCRKLTYLTLPEEAEAIMAEAFSECLGIGSVKLPRGITFVADGLFKGSIGLLLVDVPEGVKEIGEKAFYFCVSLRKLVLPSTVTSVPGSAVGICPSLKLLSVPRTADISELELPDWTELEIRD